MDSFVCVLFMIWIKSTEEWSFLVINTPPELSVQENHAVTFTCTITGNEYANLMWERNGETLMDAFCQTDSVIGVVHSERYVITCDEQGSTLVIPAENVTEIEHDTTWKCVGEFDLSVAESADTKLYVKVPPKSPSITPNRIGQPVYTSKFKQTRLTCVTTLCRPAARIDWFVNDINVSNTDYNIITNFSGANKLDGPRVSTESTVLIPWGEFKGNETVKCVATNFASSETQIQVTHIAPGIPSIISNASGIYAGDILSLVCTETGGNPYSSFSWNGVCVNNKVISKSITFNVEKQMNGRLCFCKTLAVDNTTRSVNINLTVYFPLEVQVLVPQYLNEGDELRVICNTFGNPNKLERLTLVHRVNDVVIRTFGNISEVTIAQASYQDSGVYKCEACNGIPDSQTSQTAQNVTIIRYPATFCPYNSDQLQFYIAINQSYTVKIFFITTEKIDNMTWRNGTKTMFNTRNVYFKLYSTPVWCPFYGSKVNLSGYVAEMNIKKYKDNYKGYYSVEIFAWTKTSKSFKITSLGMSNTLNISEETDKDTYSATLKNLQPSTLYKITLSAQNIYGTTIPLINQITTKDFPCKLTFGAGLATGVGISTAVVVISFIAWCLIKKKKQITAGKTKIGVLSKTGSVYEEAVPGENKHIYMELEGVGQLSESTYHNTELQ